MAKRLPGTTLGSLSCRARARSRFERSKRRLSPLLSSFITRSASPSFAAVNRSIDFSLHALFASLCVTRSPQIAHVSPTEGALIVKTMEERIAAAEQNLGNLKARHLEAEVRRKREEARFVCPTRSLRSSTM